LKCNRYSFRYSNKPHFQGLKNGPNDLIFDKPPKAWGKEFGAADRGQ